MVVIWWTRGRHTFGKVTVVDDRLFKANLYTHTVYRLSHTHKHKPTQTVHAHAHAHTFSLTHMQTHAHTHTHTHTILLVF